jgi:hypothetical protein
LALTRFRQHWRRAVRSGWAYAVVAAVCRTDSERLWLRENVSNVLEVSFWLGLVVAAVVSQRWWIITLLLGTVAARTVWIACRVHHRSDGWASSILYGLNCQFMRIPVFVGQLRGAWHLLRRRPAGLIEYKA